MADEIGTFDPGSVWQQQRIWSQAANRLKMRTTRYRVAALALAVLGATLAALATQLSLAGSSIAMSRVIAVGAAFAVAVVPAVRSGCDKGAISDWTRVRSVSEGLKSELFCYLAHVRPYRTPDRGVLLAGRVGQILSDGADLTRHLSKADSATLPLPDVTDVDSYLRVRLLKQIHDYYRPKAREMERRLDAVRATWVVLAVVAAVFGAVAVFPSHVHTVAWVAVVTTVSAAVAAHSAESRYQYQLIEYSRTAQQLENLLVDYHSTASRTAEWEDKFVSHCEHVISIQNEAWMVKWRSD